MKQVVRVIGPQYFELEATHGVSEAADALLEAASVQMQRWGAPVPGVSLELPLLGELLRFDVPWTALHNTRRPRPEVASSAVQVDVTGSSEAAAEVAAASGGIETADDADAHTAAAYDRAAAERHSEARTPHAISRASSVNAPPVYLRDEDAAESARYHSDAAARGVTPDATDTEAMQQQHGSRAGSLLSVPSWSVPRSPRQRKGSSRRAGAPGGPHQPRRPLTMRDVFAASHHELPGVFQEVGLFSVFRHMVPCLWALWELAITGQPMLIMGGAPDACGDAVLAVVSLISPLEYCADFRPYFTLYDPDFHAITALSDAHWGRSSAKLSVALPRGAQAADGGRRSGADAPTGSSSHATSSVAPAPPPLLIGTTNPFFLKALERWPNAMWLRTPTASASSLGGLEAAAVAGGAGAVTPRRPTAASASFARDDAAGLSRTPGSPTEPHHASGSGETVTALRQSGMSSSPRLGYTVADAKPRVVSATASLADVLPAPGDSTAGGSRGASFVMRSAPLVLPDTTVLSQLLRVRQGDDEGLQLRIAAAAAVAAGSQASLSPGGGSPGRMTRANSRSASAGSLSGAGGGAAQVSSMVMPQLAGSPRGKVPPSPTGSPRPSVRSSGGGGWAWGARANGLVDGDIPAVAINNAVLRQHFRALTLAFLKPFEQYFQWDAHRGGERALAAARRQRAGAAARGRGEPIGAAPQASRSAVSGALPASSRTAPPAVGFGPYDDLSGVLLPPFDEAAFITALERRGGPTHRVLRASKWRALYRAFINGPHFMPWFNARRWEVARTLFGLSRTLRFATSVAELLAGAGVQLSLAQAAVAAVQSTADVERTAGTRGGVVADVAAAVVVGDASAAVVEEAPAPSTGAPKEHGGDTSVAAASLPQASLVAPDGTLIPRVITADAAVPAVASSPLQLTSLASARAAPSHSAQGGGAAAGAPGTGGVTSGLAQPGPSRTASPLLTFSWPLGVSSTAAVTGNTTNVLPPVNPGPLVRVVGRGMPHSVVLGAGAGAIPPTTSRHPLAQVTAANLPVALVSGATGDPALPRSPYEGGAASASIDAAARHPLSPATTANQTPPRPQNAASPQPPSPPPSPPLLLSDDDVAVSRRICAHLRAKITASFARDAAFLEDDPELGAVMLGHLRTLQRIEGV